MEDSLLKRVLNAIPRDGAIGARDYAIAILMMAYGIRGISAAELLLDDIDWQHSRIRIRAKKGGKEVMLPLMPAVGEAIIEFLRHRRSETPFREVFLTNIGSNILEIKIKKGVSQRFGQIFAFGNALIDEERIEMAAFA
jgi:integrase/recombinase XerD